VIDAEWLVGRQVQPSPRTADDEQGWDHDRKETELRRLHELVLSRQREHGRRQYDHPQDETRTREEIVEENAVRGELLERWTCGHSE
jgi:hypothetical protein